MRFVIILISSFLFGCSLLGARPENDSGMGAKIKAVKNTPEGVELTVALHNTTKQTVRLLNKGSVSVLLDGEAHVKGQLAETVDIAAGTRKDIKMHFEFINSPRIYKAGLLEMTPTKIFRSCSIADKDPTVVRDPEADSREPATEVEADTCNRALKNPIRIAF
jgi:hypothetical protein